MQQEYKRIKELNAEVIAISVDDTIKAKAMKEKTNATFDIFCDEELVAVMLYDLVDDELMDWDYIDNLNRKTKDKRKISLSANIIINQDGNIVDFWSGHYNLRPSIESTIEILRKIS